jgi:LacI family transcriptional regulator
MPAQLSVTGLDDGPVARQIYPSLATVRPAIVVMAEKSAELLLRQLSGQPLPSSSAPMSRPLFVREFIGAVR